MSSKSEKVTGFQPERLTIARERRGISQRELGRLLGLGINQISRYENGSTDPSTPILTAMAQELNVTTDYLLGLTESPRGYSVGDLHPDERRVLDAFKIGDGTALIKLMADRIREIENAED